MANYNKISMFRRRPCREEAQSRKRHPQGAFSKRFQRPISSADVKLADIHLPLSLTKLGRRYPNRIELNTPDGRHYKLVVTDKTLRV